MRNVAKWIFRNTVVARESITPSLKFHLISEQSPLWMSTPDKCPFPDPYWAFYWPGGQSITRYMLDNPALFSHSIVFDFGAGCGSVSIAAKLCNAEMVIANDIDEVALLATKINFRLNKISDGSVVYSSANFLDQKNDSVMVESLSKSKKSFIVLGDMFYDSDFADLVFRWLKRISSQSNVRILVGDPDRHPLADQKYLTNYNVKFSKTLLASYPLPGYVIKEHYGFNTANVYEINIL